MTSISPSELHRVTELTLNRPWLSAKDIQTVCQKVRDQKVYGVCVYGSRIELAASILADTDLKLTALIGGAFGNADSDVKRYETEVAIDYGAQEIEFDLNAGRLKDGDHKYVLRELRDVVEAAEERIVKVGLSWLTREEMLLACELVLDSGAHFIASRFEDLEALKLCRKAVGPKFGIKAMTSTPEAPGELAGLIEAGATRLGVYGEFYPFVI